MSSPRSSMRAVVMAVGLGLLTACAAAPSPGTAGGSPLASGGALPMPAARPGYVCAPPPPFHVGVVAQAGMPNGTDTAFSPDRQLFFVHAGNNELQIWDVPSGVMVDAVTLSSRIDRFSVRPDGRALALVTEEGLWLRELAGGVVTRVELGGRTAGALTWDPDGQTLLVAMSGAMVVPVDPGGRAGAARSALAGAPAWRAALAPSSIAWSENRRWAALSVGERKIVVVDATTGATRFEVETIGRRSAVSVSPDGASVAAYDGGRPRKSPAIRGDAGAYAPAGMTVWHQGKRIRLWAASESLETPASFSPDGSRLALLARHISESQIHPYEVVIAEVPTGATVSVPHARSLPLSLHGELQRKAPTWSLDGRFILQPGEGSLYIFDAATGGRRLVGKGEGDDELTGNRDVSFAPDDSALAIVSSDSSRELQFYRAEVSVWDLHTGGLRGRLTDPPEDGEPDHPHIQSATYSPDGQILAVVRSDGVALWDGRSPQILRLLDADLRDPEYFVPLGWRDEGQARRLAFRADGQVLATSAARATQVRLWNPHDGALLRTLRFDDAEVESLAFSPDGTRLAVAMNLREARGGGQVALFDPATGALLQVLHASAHRQGRRPLSAIHWGPRGKAIVSVDDGGAVDLWNVAADDPPTPLLPKGADGPSLLSPDGNVLFAGDSALRIWDLRSRALLHELPGDGSPIGRLRSNRAGTVVAAVRAAHVDVYRIGDGAHVVLRRTLTSRTRRDGLLMLGDDGAFSGDGAAYAGDRVRVGPALRDVRPLRPDEMQALSRPGLLSDLLAGCRLGGAAP